MPEMPFNYSNGALDRRHGPLGYANYESYRPWLRDEFMFRCVYCLERECWARSTSEFHVDHFRPQILENGSKNDYDNLFYVCVRCNLVKGNQIVPNPADLLLADQIRVLPDGGLESNSSEANQIIRKLDLNSPEVKKWRNSWIRVVELASEWDKDLYLRLMGFPEDLPNLSKLRPPGGNSRPSGVGLSYFAMRETGVLPETY